ncbi:TRAP transporter small permease subunit [Lutimaribacter sp. EGI FJ00015]|uniref:TRAP transporter small permease subunit n=1 Tax=Lutimaribacter degradans TaxID=2945989 RepID=A0ACC5ZX87_9RHOB|nr:TRAP transporter small permease [Lutimaribacter sp. EGI FJ00013]MCM2562958.1 TRAP transporter small permease subunit [Lutimaribacter sp. EGI FJ00013]MCO0614126.1 TRAP transporter small permease subunit [Lutimaribacter sp. EGI FJ00015]MCO0636103.1 TRAP transporter small permease subunit [Lutimaribacter sp. EGI FJ00014]
MALYRIRQAIRLLMVALTGAAMLVMVLLTVVDVVGRHGFNASVFGASEMIQWLMIIVVFGGIAFVTRDDAHITVGLFENLLERRLPLVSRWGRHIFTLGFYALMVWVLWRLALGGLESGRRSAVLGIPTWAFSGMGALISTLGLLGFVADLWHRRGRLRRKGRFGPDKGPS